MKNMQKMNTKQGVFLGISVGAAGLIAAACSSEEPSGPGPMPTGTVTGTTTAVAPIPGPTGSTPVITPTGPTGSNTAPVTTGPTGGTGTTTAPTVPMSTCTNVNYARDNELLAASGFPGVHVVYGYGDEKTSLCSGTATAPAMLCVEGNAVSSAAEDDSNDYLYYGAGVGLQMTAAVDGVAEAPWDAAALGIVGVKFSVSNVVGRIVRVQVAQVDEPELPYQANNFLRGGTMYAPNEIKIGDMEEVSIPLTDFKLPAWSADGLGLGRPGDNTPLDPTKIYALSFQIANAPADDTELYSFCISNLEWIDAAGAPVAVPVVTDPVPSGSGGDSSAPPVSSGDSSAPDTSGDTSGADTSGEDTGTLVNFQTDVLPIFAASCGNNSCHNGANPPPTGNGLNLTVEPGADRVAAIVERINSDDVNVRMPRNADALSAEQIATIEAWAATK